MRVATLYSYISKNISGAPPAHFLSKIESWSLLDKYGIKQYVTNDFLAGEYKWRLIFSPNGESGKHSDYISVYLAMSETDSLPANWEVTVVFSIFLFNQNTGNYRCSLGRTKRFQEIQHQWGFGKFISKKTLHDPSKGCVLHDNFVFGAEVFVVNREAITECLSLKVVETPCEHDWKISNFSKRNNIWNSKHFIAGDHKWKISLHPKGKGNTAGRYVSIYLYYVGSCASTLTERVQASFTLCINDQVNQIHEKITRTNEWFSASSNNYLGWRFLIDELDEINDSKKGLIVNDCCILNIEISVQAVVRGSIR
ncbi:hypothetical protein MIMGU_mgv1a022193mg [Erythranthe guttata]|uniref:MATH domain-containing protein n=1 Tax=Erythranthe guttata TaxID=4155 RepID=A0A022PT09_ERYGU|nr:hypothetical protein MIMGU_mgv1a022193mg [Erythranthe guttata]